MKRIVWIFFCLLSTITDVFGQWIHIGGPDGATTSPQSSAFVTNGKYIFAAINRNGIFRSSDNGVSWSSVTNNISSIAVTAIATIDTMVFVATTEVLGFIFRSSDNGASWQTITNLNLPVRRIMYAFAGIDRSLFVATDTGVFVSSDMGGSWNPAGLSGISVHSLFVESSNLYAGTQPEGVYVSTDKGKNWTQAKGKFSPVSYSGIAVEGFTAGGGKLFAGAFSGIYQSNDAGKNWFRADSTQGVRSLAFLRNIIFAGRTYYDNGLFGEILRSTDNGITWSTSNPDPNHLAIMTLSVVGETLYTLTGSGVYYSTDLGKSWVPELPSQSKINFLKETAVGFVAGVDASVWHAIDSDGANWQFMNMWPGMNILLSQENKLIAGIGRTISTSSDSGRSWVINSSELDYGISCLAVEDSIIIAGTNCGGIFRLNRNTQKWDSMNSGLPYRYAKAIGIIDSVVIVNTENCGPIGYVATSRKFLSQDFWEYSSIPYASYIQTFLVSGSSICAGTSYGVYRSSDLGISWSDISAGSFKEYVTSLSLIDSVLYAGTSDGKIYFSRNDGASWSDISAGLGKAQVNSIAIHGKYIFAGTDTGLWRRPILEIQNSSIVPASTNRKDYLISFPNPFSQSTSIKFTSDKSAFAQVSIHNLLGSEVARLFAGSLDGGEHSFTWDARGMPAGMYICILRASGRTQELPVMLVK